MNNDKHGGGAKPTKGAVGAPAGKMTDDVKPKADSKGDKSVGKVPPPSRKMKDHSK